MGSKLPLFSAIFVAVVSYYYPEVLKIENYPKTTLDVKNEYDFIIVGAGSAGSVVASRLSEVNQWKVAVFEAGGDETLTSKTPRLFRQLLNTFLSWNYTSQKQSNACLSINGLCPYYQGRVLGGTSSINGLLYVRGNKYDFNSWEEMGLKEWGNDNVLPYFLKSEDMKEDDLASTPYHQRGGPVTIQYSGYQSPIVPDLIESAREIGLENRDYNGKYQSGISKPQMYIRGGLRFSMATAFLTPASSRPNLSIIKNTFVTKLIIDPKSMTAVGIEYRSKDGVTKVVRAKKEVILSAGSINSPKLLMLSGVGPKTHLKKVGVRPLVDLPVGDNLQDHPRMQLPFQLKSDIRLFPDFYSAESMLDLAINKSGPLVATTVQTLIFANTNNISSEIPNVEIFLTSPLEPSPPDHNVLTLSSSILRPDSRGTIRLRSSNPDDPPLIQPNLLSTKSDRYLTLDILKFSLKFMKTKAMEKYLPELQYSALSYCPRDLHNETEFLTCVGRHYTYSNQHMVGTVKMGSDYDRKAVVTPQLKVRGVKNLRVIDSSIMPNIIGGNPLANTVMIAEKGSDIIKEFYR